MYVYKKSHLGLMILLVVFGIFITPMDILTQTPSEMANKAPEGLIFPLYDHCSQFCDQKISNASNNMSANVENWYDQQINNDSN